MEIKIIAIASDDGWAFIIKERKIFLLRPLYTSSNLIEVSEKDVENAIHLHGFKECEIILNSVSETIRFLKKEYIKSKKAHGVGLPSSEQLKKLLEYATDDVLLKYLKKAKHELIPDRKFDAAESIVLELMKLEKVKNSPKMQEMGIDILEKCREGRKRLEESILQSVISKESWAIMFPEAVNKYPIDSMIEYQKSISARGQLLPIGREGA